MRSFISSLAMPPRSYHPINDFRELSQSTFHLWHPRECHACVLQLKTPYILQFQDQLPDRLSLNIPFHLMLFSIYFQRNIFSPASLFTSPKELHRYLGTYKRTAVKVVSQNCWNLILRNLSYFIPILAFLWNACSKRNYSKMHNYWKVA